MLEYNPMADLNIFKDKTPIEIAISLILAVVLFLGGWILENLPFQDLLSKVAESVEPLYLLVIALILFLLLLSVCLYSLSQSQKIQEIKR